MIVENITDSVIILPFSIKCLYIKNITRTHVYVGSVSGASFVDGAKDGCNIHLQSHQIRIHNSNKTTFFLTAKSNPIIEHCTEMTFSPYLSPSDGSPALSFQGWEEQCEQAGLKLTKNLYDQVLDFNWHKQDKSPNWDAVAEATTMARVL